MATVDLYVTSFDSSATWGNMVWTPPYLNAQDEPANLCSSTSRNDEVGNFGFDTSADLGSINSVKLYLYAYGVATNDFEALIDVVGTGLGPPAGSWSWVNVDVSAILTSWAEVNAALLYLDRPNTTNDAGVDAAYLQVDYTPGDAAEVYITHQ